MSEQETLEAVLVGGVALDVDGDAWQKREDGWHSAGPKQSYSAWSDADLTPDLAQVERQRSAKSTEAEDTQTPPMVQCPTSTETSDIVGCGRLVPDERDDEGFVDCPRCGICFDPEREK